MAAIDRFFEMVVAKGASDLHLTAGQPPSLRLHGEIQAIENEAALSADDLSTMLSEITPEANQKQFENCGDTDFAYALSGQGRFRANRFLNRLGPGAVFRLIPEEILGFEELGLPPSLKSMCLLNKGLVLVTGPTGSGKSTTLAAMIDHINRSRKDHIITIEDPIEFVHQSQECLVNQREVGVHTQSFSTALRAALREDPDIVLVGEMRDLETTRIAIETAETGHLVFGTLHTSTAASTVDRIIDQFPADEQSQIRTMLSASLKGVVAQTLCKKKGGGGRVAALEVMVGTVGVAACVREGKTHQLPSQIQTGAKHGMTLLNDALLKLVKEDMISPEEAYLKSIGKEELTKRLGELGHLIDPAKMGAA